VIVVEPTETPVTTPEAFTVAIEVFDEVHRPPVIPLEVNEDVPPTQTVDDPLSVPASAGATMFGVNDWLHVNPPNVMVALIVNV
jgi:hypothetical protein